MVISTEVNVKNIVKIPLGIVSGFVNGLLGTGCGILLVFVTEICGIKPKTAHATAISVILPLTIVSVVVYLRSGNIQLVPAIVVGISGGVGGFVGARLLKKTPDFWLKIFFGVTILALGINMIFR